MDASWPTRLLTVLLTPAAVAVLFGPVSLRAHAQDVTGVHQGADAAPVSGGGTLNTNPNPPDPNGGKYILDGNGGDSGISLSGAAINAHNAALQGGRGGDATGTNDPNDPNHPSAFPDIVNAGTGGSGLSVHDDFILGPDNMYHAVPSTATVNSGTYNGSTGGNAGGTAIQTLVGGYGGDGLNINDSTATVNGGTFHGGSSGVATGTAPDRFNGFGGSGVNVNFNGDAVINGGTFIGGNGADYTRANADDQSGPGAAGSGVIVLTNDQHTVSIYGGAFTAGNTGALFASDGILLSPVTPGNGLSVYGGTTTLFGTSFTYTVTDNTGTRAGVGPATFTSGPNGQPYGTITGFLQNNSQVTPTTITFGVYGGTLILAGAPESSQTAAFGLGVLGLGGLGWRARRKTVPSL